MIKRSKVNPTKKEYAELVAFVHRIQDALGTEETGSALLEVARNARHAELVAATGPKDPPSLEHIAQVIDTFLNLMEPLFKRNEDGYMEMELMLARAMKAALRNLPVSE